jgi:hydroxyacylglutathione hydrolase
VVGPAEVERLSPVDRKVAGGDSVKLGETTFEVIESGGHTLGHIAFHDAADRVAFVGDTLFALGCGRLFEGTPAQMWDSLSRLTALPDDTAVYCAHEYTASNARFALSVDASPELKARTEAIFAARELGEWTVPTTIGLEKATNPFLRAPGAQARHGPARGLRRGARGQGRLQGIAWDLDGHLSACVGRPGALWHRGWWACGGRLRAFSSLHGGQHVSVRRRRP